MSTEYISRPPHKRRAQIGGLLLRYNCKTQPLRGTILLRVLQSAIGRSCGHRNKLGNRYGKPIFFTEIFGAPIQRGIFSCFALISVLWLSLATQVSAQGIPFWPPDLPDCPGGAWCHPGGIPLANSAEEAASKVGDELSNYKCSLSDPKGCLGYLASKLNCIGPKGEVRQELCDSANKKSTSAGPTQDYPVLQLRNGYIITGYRSKEHVVALFRILDSNSASENGVICLPDGFCYCPVDWKFKHPSEREGDFVAVCQEGRMNYIIMGEGDMVYMMAPSAK